MMINCQGTLVDLRTPKVMGILNVTPDSFFDGGRYKGEAAILARVEAMRAAGATFIDMGAYSSRPGADYVSEDEELRRLLPLLEVVLKNFPDTLVSIDTFRSKVAAESLQRGAALINDISAGSLDPQMFSTVARYQVPYVMTHLKGTPQSMQDLAVYTDVLREVHLYFSQKMHQAATHKINDVILDPGFGFAKTLEHNYTLLHHLEIFQTLGAVLLVGISRKSMIYKVLKTSAQEALNGSTALHAVALLKGANILRVHDVKEAMECITLVETLKANALQGLYP